MRGAARDWRVIGCGWTEMDAGGEGKMKIRGALKVEATGPGRILVESGSIRPQNIWSPGNARAPQQFSNGWLIGKRTNAATISD